MPELMRRDDEISRIFETMLRRFLNLSAVRPSVCSFLASVFFHALSAAMKAVPFQRRNPHPPETEGRKEGREGERPTAGKEQKRSNSFFCLLSFVSRVGGRRCDPFHMFQRTFRSRRRLEPTPIGLGFQFAQSSRANGRTREAGEDARRAKRPQDGRREICRSFQCQARSQDGREGEERDSKADGQARGI